jgi:transcriptional regulator
MLYTKEIFQPGTMDEAFDLVDEVTLGTLVTSTGQDVQISHPVFMSNRSDNRLVSHLAVGNDHAEMIRAGTPSTAIIMDHGSYISSSWFPAEPSRDSAPTWAFRVAHFYGRIEPLSQAATATHLSDLVSHLEKKRPGAWKMAELGPGGLERRMPRIIGYELVIERLEVSFRLGQDERDRDMNAAASALRLEGQQRLADRILAARKLEES